MNEDQITDIVENFKGITWDELNDALAAASTDDLRNLIRMLKVRFG
ncbi:MAG: hypothetical protein ABFC12_06300 [Methanobacterium sp.]